MSRLAVIAMVGMMLGGCVTAGPGTPEPIPGDAGATPPVTQPAAPAVTPTRHNLTGYSPAFRQGYGDGCDGGRRDEARMKADADYSMGWSDGRSMCSRRPVSR